MDVDRDEEFGSSTMSGSAVRSSSGSYSRSRKNSRIATVKPVTKCLSSSEEDLTKGEKAGSKGSASPRIARLLSRDMTSMDKDVIVAELEKCLSELENNDNPYSALSEEYKRIEEERDELAKELENAFGDLEGYMHHVREIETALRSSDVEKEELAKEVEYLKYCLTHRQEVEQSSLKLGKEALETHLKEVKEENEKMKEQINELLNERESLIQSLLNLHSSEVDDVIQTRSRSCSVVSTDSASSSMLRSECFELKERTKEAEEAELKLSGELMKCRGYLEESLREKAALENSVNDLKEELNDMEEDELDLRDKLEKVVKEKEEEGKAKDAEMVELKQEMAEIKGELAKSMKNDKKLLKESESKDKASEAQVIALEEEKSLIGQQLNVAKEDLKKCRMQMAEEQKEFKEVEAKLKKDTDIIRAKDSELKSKTRELSEGRKEKKEIEDEVVKLQKEKAVIEKKITDLRENLLNERTKSNKEKANLEKVIAKLKDELDSEKGAVSKLQAKDLLIHELHEEIATLKGMKGKCEKELEKLKSFIRKNEQDVKTEKINLKRKESDLSFKEKELIDRREEVDHLKEELKRTSTSHEELKKEKNRIAGDLQGLNERLGKEKELFSSEKRLLNGTIETLQLKVNQLKGCERDLKKVRDDLGNEKRLREKTEVKNAALKEELDEERKISAKERGRLEKELKSSADRRKGLEEKLQSVSALEEKLDESNFTVRKLEQCLDDAAKEKTEVEGELSSQIEEIKSKLEEEKKKAKDGINSSKSTSDGNSEKQITRLKSKVDDLNIFIERAETKVRELDGEVKSTKKQLADSENHVSLLRKEKSTMQLEVGRLRSETCSLKTDLEKVARQLRIACADVERTVNEKKSMKEELECSKLELDNMNAMQRLAAESEESLMSEKIKKHLEDHEELRKELLTEINRLKEEQRLMEHDLKSTESHLEQAQEKEMKFRHSIEGLCENIERLRQEKSQTERAFELSKSENNELSAKLKKLSQNTFHHGSEGSRNTAAEADELRHRCASLQEELTNAHLNNKNVVDKLRNSEDSNANATRSLKARKNELQIQLTNVQHEKEDLEKEFRVLKSEITTLKTKADAQDAQKPVSNELVKNLEERAKTLKDSFDAAQTKMKILEAENEEYKEKLNESEELIHDLQKAVARANDVAMEKALDSSRHKRVFEKKFEKILKENFALRKQVYFDGPTLIENDVNLHGRSYSDLTSTEHGKYEANSGAFIEHNQVSNVGSEKQRNKSSGALHTIIVRDIDKDKTSSLTRSGSAPITQREGDLRPIRTKVTAGSVSPPVRYTSDTESVGSKADSNEGDFIPSSQMSQKSSPTTYNDSKEGKEDERKAIPQPNRIHRPILLKEIKLPSFSPAEERRAQGVRTPERRSPVIRSQAMRRNPDKRATSVEKDVSKSQNGKERMEHWV